MHPETVDMTKGRLSKQILRFSMPLIFSNLLQMAFNLADQAVVGNFAGSLALGEVGSTTTLILFLTAFIIGTGGGVNIVTARFLGSGQHRKVREVVHTSLPVCLGVSVVTLLIGQTLAVWALDLIGTRPELRDGALVYLRIYILGVPAMGVFNYGRAVCNAMGETRKPFLYLLYAGALNLLLNLIFVLAFRLDVIGVAIASVVSEYLSALLVIRFLIRLEGPCALSLHRIRIYPEHAREVLALGLTAGAEEAAFSFSNLFLQSAINSFGPEVVAGHAVALNADTITFGIMGGFWTACASFTSQNIGAGDKKRFLASYGWCVLFNFMIGVVCGGLLILFRYPFLHLFTPDEEIVKAGLVRLVMLSCFYPFCVAQDCSMAALRSMGQKLVPLIISLMGTCVFRIVWIYTVFARFRTLTSLYFLYIFSFVLCTVAQVIYLKYHVKRWKWKKLTDRR